MIADPEAEALRRQVEEASGVALIAAEQGVTPYCPTGALYVTLVVGGVKPAGAAVSDWRKTKGEAIAAFLHSVAEYAHGKATEDACLFWRKYPEIVESPNGWQVYARLVIDTCRRPEAQG